MVFHYNKWYKSSAFTLALCGTMNPTILAAGLVFIIEYLVGIINQKPESSKFITYIFSRFKEITAYGCCWIIALIPFAYNYYNTGYINLTAAYPRYTESADSVLIRMFAYIFDWNFGILPYFPFILIAAVVLTVVAVFRKQWRYISMMLGFMATAYSYSMMAHVNCGISGISRYNAWNCVIMIIAVSLYFDKIIPKKADVISAEISLAANAVICGAIVNSYGINRAMYTDYKFMTPAAELILDNAPMLYNPLHSTFNSRVIHKDGGYNFETPIVYCNKNGEIRKILANKNDAEMILNSVYCSDSDKEWLSGKLNDLGESDEYINVPKSRSLIKAVSYEMGEDIVFCEKNYNVEKYIISGFWTAEKSYSWTSSKEASMNFKINSDKKKLHCLISIESVYAFPREVICEVNGKKVYNANLLKGCNIEFDFNNDTDFTNLKIIIPSAEITNKIYETSDTRMLGLAVKSIKIE